MLSFHVGNHIWCEMKTTDVKVDRALGSALVQESVLCCFLGAKNAVLGVAGSSVFESCAQTGSASVWHTPCELCQACAASGHTSADLMFV